MRLSKKILTGFKKELQKSAKMFGKQPHQVTYAQWSMSGGSNYDFIKAFGYTALKQWAFPSPNVNSKTQDAVNAIKRILNAA